MTLYTFYTRDSKTLNIEFAATFDLKTKKYSGPYADLVKETIEDSKLDMTDEALMGTFYDGTYFFIRKGKPVDLKKRERPPKSKRLKVPRPKNLKKSLKKGLFSP